MSSKKGQIALFIILGIVILVAIGFYLAISGTQDDTITPVHEMGLDMKPLQTFVEECMSKVGHESVTWIAHRGGYYKLPDLSTNDLPTIVPYYYLDNQNYMPSEEKISEELANYMNGELKFCIKNFIDFNDQGYLISHTAPKVTVDFGPERIIYNLDMGVSATLGDKKGFVRNFRSAINVPLGKYYFAAQDLLEVHTQNPNSICLSCITQAAYDNKVTFDLFRVDNTVLYTIRDSPYKYMFAIEYEEISCTSIPETFSDEQKQQLQLECLRDGLGQLGGY